MQQESAQKAVGSVRQWESLVAVLFLVFGSIVMWDSWRIGSRCRGEGPHAVYVPFYVGLMIVVSAPVILYAPAKGKDAVLENSRDLSPTFP